MAANAFDEFDAPASTTSNTFDEFDVAAPPKPSTAKRVIKDIGTSLKRGVESLPGVVTGVADLGPAAVFGVRPFNAAADVAGDVTGFKPSQWAKETQLSPESAQSAKEIGGAWAGAGGGETAGDQATRFLEAAPDIAKAYARNPAYVANQVAESLPASLAGGAVSRPLMTAGRAAIPAAEGVAARTAPGYLERAVGTNAASEIAGGLGEGVVQAGSALDQAEGTDQQRNAIAALGSGIGDAAIAVGAGRAAHKLGLETSQTAMAKGFDAATGTLPPVSALHRILGGAVNEAVLQELPQSFQEKIWQNYAEGKPLLDGAIRQGIEGAMAGAVMGGAFNIRGGGQAAEAAPDITATDPAAQPPAPPVAPAGPLTDVAQAVNPGAVPAVPAVPAGEPIRAAKLPEGGPLSRGVNALLEGEAQAADAGQPVPAPVAGALAGVPNEDVLPGQQQNTPAGGAKPSDDRAAQGAGGGNAQAQRQQPTTPPAPVFDPATGEIKQPQRTTFPTIEAVQAFISQARLNGSARIGKVTPVQLPDGQFSYVREGEVGYEQALAESKKKPSLADRRAKAKKEQADGQPQLPGVAAPAVVPAQSADGAGDLGGRSGGTLGGVAADPAGGIQAGAAAPAAGARAPAPVGEGSQSPAAVDAPKTLADRRAQVAGKPQPTTLGTTIEGRPAGTRSTGAADVLPKAAPVSTQAQAGEPAEGAGGSRPTPAAVVEHTTVKGKILRGVWRDDFSEAQAKAIDPYSFNAKGKGWFIREKHLAKLPPVGQPNQATAGEPNPRASSNDTNQPTRADGAEAKAPADQAPAPAASDAAGAAGVPAAGAAAADEAAGVNLTQTDNDYWKSPKRSSYEHAGRADFKAGKRRELPSYFTDSRSANAKAWFRGFDRADKEHNDFMIAAIGGDKKSSTETPGTDETAENGDSRPAVDKPKKQTLADRRTAAKEAKQPAPAPKSDKAEIRPYRRADGSIGYEAVPIIKSEPEPAAAPKVSANTVFTEDAYQAARARLKAKLGRVQSGIDPETMMDGITTAGYHIEKGARTFVAYARAMVADLGDAVKPYLVSWYMAVRNDPNAAAFRADMAKASEVEDFEAADIDRIVRNADDPNVIDVAPNGQTFSYRTQDGITVGDRVEWDLGDGNGLRVGTVQKIHDTFGARGGYSAVIEGEGKSADKSGHRISVTKLKVVQAEEDPVDVVNGNAPAADLPASKRLVLMPCSQMKADKAAPAIDLYTGVFFQSLKAQTKPGAEPNVVILSAEHGFLNPGDVIAPYDTKMTFEGASSMLASLRKQMSPVEWPKDIQDVLIVGGKEYQRVMRAAVRELIDGGSISKDASVNATAGEIGVQRSQFGQYLNSIPASPAEDEEAGTVVIPASEEAFAEALGKAEQADGVDDEGDQSDVLDWVDGESARYEATFRPDIKPVALPRVSSKTPKPAGMEFISTQEAATRLESWKAEAARQGREQSSEDAEAAVRAAAGKRSIEVEGKAHGYRYGAAIAAAASVKEQQAGDDKAKFTVNMGGKRITSETGIENALDEAFGDETPFEATVFGEKVIARRDAARAIVEVAREKAINLEKGGSEGFDIGEWAGMKFVGDVSLSRYGSYAVQLSLLDEKGRVVATGTPDSMSEKHDFSTQFIRSAVDRLFSNDMASSERYSVRVWKDRAASAERDLPELRRQAAEAGPFKQADELEAKRQRLEEVTRVLSGAGRDLKHIDDFGSLFTAAPSNVGQDDFGGQFKPDPRTSEPAQAAAQPADADAVNFSMADEPASPFYSELSTQIGKSVMRAGTADAWKQAIKGMVANGKAKADEVEWSGLAEWLDLQTGKITKEQIGAYLDANGVKVTETVLGGKLGADLPAGWSVEQSVDTGTWHVLDDESAVRGEGDTRDDAIEDAQDESESGVGGVGTKYARYTVPGGTNYREVLLTLPAAQRKPLFNVLAGGAAGDIIYKAGSREEAQKWIDEHQGLPAAKRARIVERTAGQAAAREYKSSHWDQPNILAHVRVDDRTDADGKKVLFVNEIQSDWGQEGKKKGFKGANARSVFDVRAEMQRVRDALGERTGRDFRDEAWAKHPDLNDRYKALQAEGTSAAATTPAAPFVGKTDAWVALAIKRVIKMATDGGYDRVAFINGDQAADLYDLSKQIENVHWNPGYLPNRVLISLLDKNGQQIGIDVQDGIVEDSSIDGAVGKPIEDVLGKELAQKIMGEPAGELSGDGLKVGGEGMRAFYDRIVPSVAKNVLRKVGGGSLGKIELGALTSARMNVVKTNPYTWQIQGDGGRWLMHDGSWGDRVIEAIEFGSEAAARESIRRQTQQLTQPGFDITPELREKVADGVPLFRLAEPVAKSDTGAYANASPEHQALAERFNERIARSFPGTLFHAVAAGGGSRAGRAATGANERDGAGDQAADRSLQAVQTIAKRLFGHEVVFVKFAGTPLFNGAMSDKIPGVVFINVESKRPHMAVLGHELLHQLRATNPTTYNVLKMRLERLLRDPKAHYAALQAKYDKAGKSSAAVKFEEELHADIVGDFFMDPQFWQDMARDRPGLFKRVVNAVLKFLDDTLAKMTGSHPFGTDKIVADVRAARAAVVDAFGQFSGTQVGAMTDQSEGISLSLADSLADNLNSVRDINLPAGYKVGDLFSGSGKLNWWHKTVGTMHNLAQRSPEFRRVYDATQNFINDTSYYASEAANLAPTILPKLETIKDIRKQPLSAEDSKAISAPIFEGTLTWARDEHGKPVQMAELQRRAESISPQDKGLEMLRRGVITEQVLRMWRGLPLEQYEANIETRYQNQVLRAGVVWSVDELRSQFKLTGQFNEATQKWTGQIGLYKEFRAAVDKSLADLAISDMVRYGGGDVESVRQKAIDAGSVDKAAEILRDHLFAAAEAAPDRASVLNDSGNRMIDKAERATDLMKRGYAPLSRYGQYTLDVVTPEGERAYFGMFETSRDRARMARQMQANFPGASIIEGTVSEEAYKLFAGVSPETLELFGDMLGLEAQGSDAASQAFQTYLKVAKANRSAMKRLIERKGIEGFSEDAGRVLAGFVYSNGRQTSANLHTGEMTDSVAAISQRQGQLKDAAVQLTDYVRNPREEAQALRGLLFAQYLGGSVASAMVNALQPAQVTFPYLSQFIGVRGSARQMVAATRDAFKRFTGDRALDAALKKAEEEGIVSPQEVHQLMAQARGAGALKSGDGTKLGNALAGASNYGNKVLLAWGKVFGVAEQFNRRVTFIAAYRTAVEKGMSNPAAFAEKAIADTQFTYNKGNKPGWARGAIGSTLFTFKQYSVNYVELISRMAKSGPEGRKAALLALGVLVLMAGTSGLPGADDLDDLIDGALQRLGYNFDSKVKRRQFFADTLGMGLDGAQFIERGLSGLPGAPIDVSGRLGLGNLLPGTGLFTKRDNYSRDIAEVFGPAGDLAARTFKAAGQVLGGDVGGALSSISPVAAQNAIKAADMANTGMYRDQGGKKVIDVDGYDAAMKAIGFQPNDVARVQTTSGEVRNMVSLNKLREKEISAQWAQAIIEKDPDAITAARKALLDWNTKNPESPIRIKPQQIQQQVKNALLTREQRLQRSAPKEIRAEVARELAAAR